MLCKIIISSTMVGASKSWPLSTHQPKTLQAAALATNRPRIPSHYCNLHACTPSLLRQMIQSHEYSHANPQPVP